MEWISCEKRYPKKEGSYLVYAESQDPKIPFIAIAVYVPHHWELIPKAWADAVTHWMPLPKKPKKGKR